MMAKKPKFVKTNTQLIIESIKDISPHFFAMAGVRDISGGGNVIIFDTKDSKIKIVMNHIDKTYTLYINSKRVKTNITIKEVIDILAGE
jgi:hypothetical protein